MTGPLPGSPWPRLIVEAADEATGQAVAIATAGALSLLDKHLRRDGIPAPPWLAPLRAERPRVAPSGPERPTLDSAAEQGECPPQRPLLNGCEAAAALGVSTRTVRRLIASGDLAAVHVRRRRLVHPDDLERYVEKFTA